MRFFLSSGRRAVFCHCGPCFVQAFAFTKGLLLSIPRPREPASPSDPSSLQPKRGFAATIQFPQGTSGEIPAGGICPDKIGIGPKHAATPIAPVIVGVINNRKKFMIPVVPRYQPAFIESGHQASAAPHGA